MELRKWGTKPSGALQSLTYVDLKAAMMAGYSLKEWEEELSGREKARAVALYRTTTKLEAVLSERAATKAKLMARVRKR